MCTQTNFDADSSQRRLRAARVEGIPIPQTYPHLLPQIRHVPNPPVENLSGPIPHNSPQLILMLSGQILFIGPYFGALHTPELVSVML